MNSVNLTSRSKQAVRERMKSILLVVFAAVMIVAFCTPSTSQAATATDAVARTCKTSTVIGHRGTKVAGVKENTMAAFRKAVADGAQVIEVDIHRTATYKDPATKKKVYKWVLAHDKTIRGNNGKAYTVKKTSYPTLKRVQPDLVTLDEFLNYMRTTNRRAFIEIKPTSITKPAVKSLGKKISAYGMTSRVEIHSFNEKVLRKFNKYKKYGIRTGFIVNNKNSKTYRQGGGKINDFANTLVLRNDLVTSSSQIASYKRAGLHTYIYTLNSATVWQKYGLYGLHGVITDVAGPYKAWCAGIQPKPPVTTPPPVTPPTPVTPPPVTPDPETPPAPETEPFDPTDA